jgi:hypothetical protein
MYSLLEGHAVTTSRLEELFRDSKFPCIPMFEAHRVVENEPIVLPGHNWLSNVRISASVVGYGLRYGHECGHRQMR